MRLGATWIVVVWLAAGCAASRQLERDPYGEPAGAGPDALSASLRVFVVTQEGQRTVAEDETLRSGDKLLLSVRTSQQAYVYAVLKGPDGSVTVLYPTVAYQMATPSCPLRIPDRGSLYLQDPPGTENLQVVVSKQPLGQVDPQMCRKLQLPCSGAQLAGAQAPPCAPPPGDKARGVLPAVKTGRAGPSGLLTLTTSLRHDP